MPVAIEFLVHRKESQAWFSAKLSLAVHRHSIAETFLLFMYHYGRGWHSGGN